MTDPDDPAFPFQPGQYGLTKREYFAALAMQGNNANVITSLGTLSESRHKQFQVIAQACVEMADALIAELNKEPK